MPNLKWSKVKSVPSYSNISKNCLLCLQEKLQIVNFEDQDHLLNKRSELISKFVGIPTNIYYVITKQTINFTPLNNY